MQFKSFEDGIEVNGRTIYSIVDGFRVVKSIPMRILRDHGIGEVAEDERTLKIKANEWYPQQKWLEAFEEISESMGDVVLYQIGLKIPENAQFPPWVNDIHSAIKSIDIAYHMNHRKNGKPMFDPETGNIQEGIGHYGYKAIEGKNQIECECRNPYPCEFDRGIVTTMAGKFNKSATVKHAPGSCRKNGAESCLYVINWH